MTLPTTFEITLDFLSDWHVGTGQGRLGTIDAEVRRDADGLPFVPAKTLVGVLRDACETVAATFDRATGSTVWQEWVTWLFGSQSAQVGDLTAGAGRPPVPAALCLAPARAPAWLRAGVRQRPELAQAAVVLRPGVRIDDKTGTAADRLLRVEERAIRGLRLHSQVSVAMLAPAGVAAAGSPAAGLAAATDVPVGDTAADGIAAGAGELPVPAELLLRAGARLVEGIGGKRNRGCGRVAVLLPGARVDTTQAHPTVTDPRLVELLAAGVPGAPPPPVTFGRAEVHPYDRLHPDRRRTVRVVFRVVTPVVAAHDVLGNVIFSRDVIPGTALLGTVLARAEPASGGQATPGGHQAASSSHGAPGGKTASGGQAVIGDQGRPGSQGRLGEQVGLRDVGVGDAVPAHGDPADPASVVPALPVPMVWQRSDKGRGKNVYNALRVGRDEGDRAKPMQGWIAPHDGGWRHVEPVKTVATHAVVDDEARRPTVASGGVYTYLGIAAGTLLSADVVLPVGVRLRLSPGERLRFGRSRKDDFGLVEVVAVTDAPPSPRPPDPGTGPLRVWCVSDVLLYDERLVPDPSPQALARALSQALAPAKFEVDENGTVSAATRRDGFGVSWGRPRPSQVAMRAGSVVTLTATGRLDRDRLAVLERDGIGERTAEGYGRIRFNPPELAVERPAVDFSDADPCPAPDTPHDPVSADHLDRTAEPVHPLEINAWRRAIRRASADLDPDKLVPGIRRMAGNRAQLGSLRAQLERLALPGGRDMVRHWIEGTRAVRVRREAWGERVLDDLARLLLDEPDLIWRRLGLAGQQPQLVLGPGREDGVREQLLTEAVSTAITDALRHLLRSARTGLVPGPASAAARGTAETPARKTAGAPTQRTTGTPVRGTDGAPTQRTTGTPVRGTDGTPAQGTTEIPARKTAGAPTQGTAGTPAQRTAEIPARGTAGPLMRRLAGAPVRKTRHGKEEER